MLHSPCSVLRPLTEFDWGCRRLWDLWQPSSCSLLTLADSTLMMLHLKWTEYICKHSELKSRGEKNIYLLGNFLNGTDPFNGFGIYINRLSFYLQNNYYAWIKMKSKPKVFFHFLSKNKQCIWIIRNIIYFVNHSCAINCKCWINLVRL